MNKKTIARKLTLIRRRDYSHVNFRFVDDTTR